MAMVEDHKRTTGVNQARVLGMGLRLLFDQCLAALMPVAILLEGAYPGFVLADLAGRFEQTGTLGFELIEPSEFSLCG